MISNSYKSYHIKRCQISNSKKLVKILDLGFLPPVNLARNIKDLKKEEFFFPTELLYCPVSKLFQLSYIVDKKILFPKSYPYTSSTTKILRDNFEHLFNFCVAKNFINKNDLIIDIGSNDGNLLSNFKNYCRVLGVTPENIGKQAIKKGIPTILDYFDKKVCSKIIKEHGKAKIITATNVFAHVDKANELVRNIKNCLHKSGIFIAEVHYLVTLIKDLQYDTIYHEHMRYYSIQSLQYLLKKHNMFIFHAEEIPTHGGSIRIFASKNNLKKSNKYKKILIKEKKYLSKVSLDSFRKKVFSSKLNLLKIINQIKAKNKKIYAVGAPSRASTLVNFTGLDDYMIDCVLEINGSHKINNYMPGTNIPIVNEDIIKKKEPDYLLLLSWHIAKDLIKIFKKRGYKGKYIIPLPKVKIV